MTQYENMISKTYIGQNMEIEKQSIQLIENWILNWLNLYKHWLLVRLKVVLTLMKTTICRMSTVILGFIPLFRKCLLQVNGNKKNGKYWKISRTP